MLSSRRRLYEERGLRRFWLLAVLALVLAGRANAQTPIDEGFQDFSYPNGTGSNNEVSSEKPESKLWFNDGFWWASMWSGPASGGYHIYKLDAATQAWVDTGTELDDRRGSKADTLWDGQKLYVVSHIFTGDGSPAPPQDSGRLYRYSYDSVGQTYSLDAGFPVEVNGAESETLVIAKDSTDRLWVTWVESSQVMVNHTVCNPTCDDASWATPLSLSTSVSSDDISSIIAYDNRVGVLWSNQMGGNEMHFAVHEDTADVATWTQTVIYDASSDDHISLKALEGDSAGRVFAAIKTSQSSDLIVLLVCESTASFCTDGLSAGASNDWSSYVLYDGSFGPTRPILLIDTDNRQLHVFVRVKETANDWAINVKSTDLDNITFDSTSIGTPFIRQTPPTDSVNNPSSSKGNLTGVTGMAVIASAKDAKSYFHNFVPVNSTVPQISSFSPQSGPVGTEVTITGANFSTASSVSFDLTSAGFTIDSDSQIRANVPSGATTAIRTAPA
jgi:hypothetical protein